jgi:hypothetical protein
MPAPGAADRLVARLRALTMTGPAA